MKKLVIIVWIICSFYSWGTSYAYFLHEFPCQSRRDNLGITLVVSVAGPISALVNFALSGFNEYGWIMPFTQMKTPKECEKK